MTQRFWTDVVDDPAARHLVVAHLEPKAAEEPAALLDAFIERLSPVGEYALLTRCEENGPIILCAFTHPEDAELFATAIGAEACSDFPEWASQSHFLMSHGAAMSIANAVEAHILQMALLSPRPQPRASHNVVYMQQHAA